jgi:hypothetical protein
MDENRDTRANFVSLRNVIYVANRASPPLDPDGSAPVRAREDGTPEHPFDRIQEAIEVAPHGASILVRPGVYREDIDSLYKNITLMALDPNDPHGGPCAVIEGTGQGPAVRLTGLGVHCSLAGFIITHGKGQPAGAIYSAGANPTITNCLIVGNRSTDPGGAAVYCHGSRLALINCTIVDNCAGAQGAAVVLMNTDAALVNSIVRSNTPYGVLSLGTSHSSIRYCDIRGGWPEMDNLNAEPLFARRGLWVDPADPNRILDPEEEQAVWTAGDYHLQSQAGRWDPAICQWVQDEASSPCLDRGDPATPVEYEPAPNGGRLNLGAYGGTTQASKSFVPIGPP